LALGIKIIGSWARGLPFHLLADFVEQSVSETECSVGEWHIEFVLLREKTKLLSLFGIRRLRLQAAFPVKYGSKHDSIDGLGEFNRAVRQRDVDVVANDVHIFRMSRFGRVDGRSRKGIPNGRRWRAGWRLRESAWREGENSNEEKGDRTSRT
jgi:hypothetical protein